MAKKTPKNGFIGRYCICRATSAGVHAGTIKSLTQTADGMSSVVLADARRLWSWKTNVGIALSGVAVGGINRASSKVDMLTPEHLLNGVCEIIPCTDAAKESIHGA